MPDISHSNPFAFCRGVCCVDRRTLLEAFCRIKFPDQTVIFLRGLDAEPLLDGQPGLDDELLGWLNELRGTGNAYWDNKDAVVPIVVGDRSPKFVHKLRTAAYNGHIEALWHNNSLDHYTD